MVCVISKPNCYFAALVFRYIVHFDAISGIIHFINNYSVLKEIGRIIIVTILFKINFQESTVQFGNARSLYIISEDNANYTLKERS